MASPSDSNLHSGKVVFGRFALKRKLGEGGMGVVWLGSDTLLEQAVAIKFLPSFLLEDQVAYDLLRNEAQKAMAITHPNIVRVHDFQRDAQFAAITMEYVEGNTLSALKQDRPNGIFNPGEIHTLVMQLCEALYYAHEKAKIAHRDLKPSNLMIDRQGDLKVTDFGISAPIADSASRFTNALRSSGTLVYMSPQQLRGMAPQPSDDIYAFGATLYELFTGLPPFYTGDIPQQVISRVAPSVRARREELGHQLAAVAPVWETVIATCLAKDPKDRPASMRDIANRLSYAQQSPPRAASPTPPSAPAEPPVLHRVRAGPPSPSALGETLSELLTKSRLVAAVVVLILGGWFSVGRKKEAPKALPAAAAPAAAATAALPTPAPVAPPPKTEVAAPVPAPIPPAPKSPALSLDTAADTVFATDTAGFVLVDRAAGEVCLWQAAKAKDLVRVALQGIPVCEAFSKETNRLYLGYSDGTITVVDTSANGETAPTEKRFARHPTEPMGLLCAGRWLIVAQNRDGTWVSHHFYDSSGRIVGKRDQVFGCHYWVWSTRTQRAYFLTANVSPVDIHFEEIRPNGTLGKTGDSPYHDSQGMIGPISLMGRESSLVLGSGRVYNLASLQLEATLPTTVFALGSLNQDLFVVAETRGSANANYVDYTKTMTEAVVHRLSRDFEIQATLKLPDRPLGLGVWSDEIVVVTRFKKSTRLYRCDPNLTLRPEE